MSLSQASELGTVYTCAEIAAIGELAHARGMKLHMDGARFANAMAQLGCSPAEATWKCGVDVLSFGATKAGALAAEAVIFFDPALARRFRISPQARRPSGVQDALCLGPARGHAGGRSLAAPARRGPTVWRRALPTA